MLNQLAYVDEYGNTGLDFTKEGVSSHYIVAAIIVDESKVPSLEPKLDKVRSTHFQTGEMKSQKVGANDDRRLRILGDLIKLDFHIFALIADKRKINSEGLQYKESFLKYMHGQVDRVLFRTYPNLKMCSDEHGRKEFMEGFVKYVKERHVPSLFEQSEFGFVPSKSVLLVQLADFIAGTLARAFDESKLSDGGRKCVSILQPRILELREWPQEYDTYVYDIEPDKAHDDDEIVAMQAFLLASQFISQHERSRVPAIGDQLNFLKVLRFHSRYGESQRYVSSRTIENNLNARRVAPITEHYLRTKVVAALRDAGVLIASSPYGYKLPTCVRDLYDFVNQGSGMIRPMLSRIESCRKQILLCTKNRVDILDQPPYEYIRRFFE